MTRRSKLGINELVRYSEGEVTRSQAQEIETWLTENPKDKRRLERLNQIAGNIRQLDEDPVDPNLLEDIHHAIRELPQEQRRSPYYKYKYLAAAGVALCTLVGVGVWAMSDRANQPVPEQRSQFRIKSDGPLTNERENWAGISAYRLNEKLAKPESLGTKMVARDALLFSYTNLGQKPFKYLMVFAVDAVGEVFWYYPAYLQEDTNPTAIPIRSGVHEMELPEKIKHNIQPGPLTIYGLFVDQTLPVSKIEGAIKLLRQKGEWSVNKKLRLPIENSGQYIIQTRIQS